MPENKEPGSSFVVMGIIATVIDFIILNNTYQLFIGLFLVFMGIVLIIAMSIKGYRTRISKNNISPLKPRLSQEIPQKVKKTLNVPKNHKFYPYYGINTNLDIYPECGKEAN